MTQQEAIKLASRHRYIGLAILTLISSAAILDSRLGLSADTVIAHAAAAPQKSDPRGSAGGSQTTQFKGAMLAVGDRIKVGFFETFDAPQTTTAGGFQPGLRTFYQRLDLTGEYTVQPDGAIAVPKLGVFKVAGQFLRDAQLDIAAAFEKTMARRCEINITILERQPVYVVGPVRAPGVYKFAPGMTVLQAVAVAGGLDHGAEQLARVMDLLRERKEADTAQDRLVKALSQQARLYAERDGLEAPAKSIRLIEIAGEDRAQAFLAAEGARLDQDRLTFKEESAKRAEELARTNSEVAMLQAKLASMASQLQAKQKRLALLQSAGSAVLASTLNAAENEKVEVEARHQETSLALERAKQKVAQTTRAITFFERDRQARILRELAITNDEIENLEKTLRSSSVISKLIEGSLSQLNSLQTPPTIEIVRQETGKHSIIKAEETSFLEPGDVVRVKPAGSVDAKSVNIAAAARAF